MKVFEAKGRQGRYLRDLSRRLLTAPVGSSAAAGLGSEGRRRTSQPPGVPNPLMMKALSFNPLFHDRRVNKIHKTPSCLVAA